MAARFALFAVCLTWLAYESGFSLTYFRTTVHASLAEIVGGMDAMMAAEHPISGKSAASRSAALTH